jgi:enoyl-CoA hydratase
MLDALLEHPRPIIAAVDGPAVGGGFVLALLCDLRIAGPRAAFGFPEVTRGIPASYGAARAVVPRGTALDLCLTGRIVEAEEALRLGIVCELAGDGLAAAHERARLIAELPPGGLAMVKRWAAEDDAWRSLLDAERQAFRAAVLS